MRLQLSSLLAVDLEELCKWMESRELSTYTGGLRFNQSKGESDLSPGYVSKISNLKKLDIHRPI